MAKLFVALGFLTLNLYTYHFFASSPVIPPRATFDGFPLTLGEWECAEREKMTSRVERNLGVTDYLICTYEKRDSAEVSNLYVGYHAAQIREEGGGAKESSIHPPAHCLPGSGWDIIESRTVSIDLPGMPQTPARAKRLIVAKGEARQLVYYWYQSRGRVISEDWQKILYVGWDRATRGRTDGSLVRFTTPIVRNDEDRAEAAFRDLAPLVMALLSDYIPD